MTPEQLEELVARLDAGIEKADARVKIEQYGGGPDETRMIATRAGYLRLGVEMLKAGLSPNQTGARPWEIDVDLDYLVTEDSQVQIDWWERPDEIPVETPKHSGRWAAGALLLFVLVGAAMAIVGLVTVVKWFAT